MGGGGGIHPAAGFSVQRPVSSAVTRFSYETLGWMMLKKIMNIMTSVVSGVEHSLYVIICIFKLYKIL